MLNAISARTCPKPIIKAAADVKPESTGCDKKRVTKPILKRPMANIAMPEMKAEAMASTRY